MQPKEVCVPGPIRQFVLEPSRVTMARLGLLLALSLAIICVVAADPCTQFTGCGECAGRRIYDQTCTPFFDGFFFMSICLSVAMWQLYG